jgi:3-polyprenyl-4-hydroxybenzoate decarboxylase
MIRSLSLPVSARSKAVCNRLVAGVAGSNFAEGMDVCPLCLYVMLSCVDRGLCDGLITRPEESYHASKFV